MSILMFLQRKSPTKPGWLVGLMKNKSKKEKEKNVGM
jgi:hypothetical protein